MLAPGGVRAVQMPHQVDAPSHGPLREVARSLFSGRVAATALRTPVLAPADYAWLLAGFGAVDAWETTYVQQLAPVKAVHPVRRFTDSTAMRPFLAGLDAA